MSKLNENIFDELKSNITGDVYTDKLRRYMLSTDGSIFRMEPACVVYPKNIQDVVQVCKFASERKFSIHSRGTGSGLCGASIGRGIVIDFSKYMNKLISFEKISDTEAVFTCEPGYRYGELEAYLSSEKLYWWPPAPSSGEYASFGGMYGTNAGGAYSVKYGNVADYIVDAEIVLHNGSVTTLSYIESMKPDELPENLRELYYYLESNNDRINSAYPPIACNVCGYEAREATNNGKLRLHKLLGGSEGTLCIVTKLTFKVIRKKPYDSLIVAYFNDKTTSAKASQIALQYNPLGIEIMDKSLLDLAVEQEPILAENMPTGIDNALLIEFEGETEEEVRKYAENVLNKITSEALTQNIYMAISEEEKSQFWAVRKAAVPILYRLKGKKKIIALVEDAAVPTEKLVEYFDGLYKIFEKHNVKFVSYGHIAKGLLHNRPLLDMKDPYDIKLLKVLADEVFDLVMELNGTISGEHGDGRIRSCYIPRQYKDIYDIFIKIKSFLDPENIFNPDIKTTNDPYQMTKYLRYGSDYSASDTGKKLLLWQEDFINEAEKCHGCSKCTTITNATRMCPIYKATRDESAAPKAKANILRALLSNSIESDAMYSEAFQFVMDKCVNCGSCSIECPSKVNIPKLALEAKSRYAEKFGVPIESKIVTKFELAGRTVRKISPIISFLMRPLFMRKISETFTGLASEREFIKFSMKSLYERVNKFEGDGEKTVIYFAGCYASYIKPEIGESSVNVLKKLGFKVIIPNQHCCGIPHLSKGMASNARKQINKNLKNWGKLIDSVDYIVTACSSCALTLMKEWLYYQDDDMTRKVSSKTVHISDLVLPLIKEEDLIRQDISLSYHSACHMKLLRNPLASIKMMKLLPGVNVEDLKSSCCGMAGSWGTLAKNYNLSIKIGSDMAQKLIDSESQIGVTDCPTCSMQMEHLGNKPILHPIEVLDRCLKG